MSSFGPLGQTIENESDYYPYGGERVITTALSDEHYKFTGKERDTETSLDEFGARYYDSSLGRFMIPDWAAKPTAVPYASVGNPQSLNLYSYVNNNPTTTRDPDGHDALWVVDKTTGQVTLVIPVHFTGSAQAENIMAIVNRDNQLDTGGSPVKIQVVSADKPVNGVLNTMDLSQGADTKNYGSVGEGVNRVGGNTGTHKY